MQLDLQQLLSRIETLIGVRPAPHASFLEEYIKAFYLPEASLEQWITTHSVCLSFRKGSLLFAGIHVITVEKPPLCR